VRRRDGKRDWRNTRPGVQTAVGALERERRGSKECHEVGPVRKYFLKRLPKGKVHKGGLRKIRGRGTDERGTTPRVKFRGIRLEKEHKGQKQYQGAWGRGEKSEGEKQNDRDTDSQKKKIGIIRDT